MWYSKEKKKGMSVFLKKLSKGQSIFATSENPNIKFFKWKYKKDVCVLSIVHKPKMAYDKCDRFGNKIEKPKYVLDFNDNMGLVDKFDMQISFNSTARKSIK